MSELGRLPCTHNDCNRVINELQIRLATVREQRNEFEIEVNQLLAASKPKPGTLGSLTSKWDKQEGHMTTAERILQQCDRIANMLLEKNKSYGDSALKPTGIFAKGKATDLIRVRIDDKLNRIKNQPDAFGEDVVLDLIGYLVLYSLALEDEQVANLGGKS